MSPSVPPTVLVYGTPAADSLRVLCAPDGWGISLDNGRARDPIFTIYENLARADAVIAFPDAHPAHLVTLIAEAEVGHPLIQHGDPCTTSKHFAVKPIVFVGAPAEWEPFRRAFSAMREQGLMRDSFERLVRFLPNVADARAYIASHLPEQIPSTRLHYYVHTKRAADMEQRERADVRPPAEVTIACFGSASTKSAAHLERTERVARMLSRAGLNILHGGGSFGVMGKLTEAGARYKAHVTGVTVHTSGAPKIFFERAAGDGELLAVDQEIASKDMLHRIETYAGHSEAFVSLDGGIGSTQEILVVAELLAEGHPAVRYRTAAGADADKPLWVLNESGIYTPLFEYLEHGRYSYLRSKMRSVATIEELEAELRAHFLAHAPVKGGDSRGGDFRRRYGELPHPKARPVASNAPAR